jgi:hypothetical protein
MERPLRPRGIEGGSRHHKMWLHERWGHFMVSEQSAEKSGSGSWIDQLSLLVIVCALLSGCRSSGANVGPSIEFTRIPQADEAGRDKHEIIEGSVTGGRAGQQIVLYARSGT